MSNLLTKFVIGTICIMILWEKMMVSPNDEVCIIRTQPLITADCSGNKISSVPQQLSQNIQVLDISDNKIAAINENDFVRYTELVTLKMSRLRPLKEKPDYVEHSEKIFVTLSKLQSLDLCYSVFSVNPVFIWPLPLKKLFINNILLNKLNLSQLSRLTELHATDNNLPDFPTLHRDAPITYMDLSRNPLSNVMAEHLAPYCRLSYVGLQASSHAPLIQASNYCKCKRLERWMTDFRIDGTPTCTKPINEDPTCDFTYTEEMMKQRNTCLRKLPFSPIWKLVIFIILATLFCPCIYLTSEIIRFINKKRKERKGKGSTKTAAEGAELEEAEPGEDEEIDNAEEEENE